MLPFNNFNQSKELFATLLEANIQEPRYPDGSFVVLKSDKISAFNSKVDGFVANEKYVFVKAPLSAASNIQVMGDGEPLVTLDVYANIEDAQAKNKKVRTITWTSNPNNYYNHLVATDGINWGRDTPTLETVQCIGVFFKGIDNVISEMAAGNLHKIRPQFEKDVLKVLSSGEDWNSKGKSKIVDRIKDLPDKDIITMAHLIQGMSDFMTDIVTFGSPHIIHGKIDDYYKSEEKNILVQVDGVKNNTADMILCDSSASDLIKAIGLEKVEFDDKGLCSTNGGIKFYQVSLKKAADGAQLGKATDLIIQKFGLPAYIDIFKQVVGENYHPSHIQYIDEGFGDFLKKSWNKLKDVAKSISTMFSKFIEGAKKLARGWINGMKSAFKSESRAAINDFSRKFGLKPKETKSLIESFDSGKMMLTEAKESINERLKKASPRDIEAFVDSINTRISNLGSVYDLHDHLDHVQDGNLDKRKIRSNFDIDVAIKLLANEAALRTLNRIFTDNASNIDALVTDLVSIQKEIYFGKTSLPLYKVYGSAEGSHSYEYLGTAADFQAKKEGQIKNKGELHYPISGFGMSASGKSQDSRYFNIESWIITGVENGQSTYAQMRMGTNQAGAFSYVVEGTKQRSLKDYNKRFGKPNV